MIYHLISNHREILFLRLPVVWHVSCDLTDLLTRPVVHQHCIVWFVVSAELLLEGDPSGWKETHHYLCHATVSPTPLFYYTKFHSIMVNLYRILDTKGTTVVPI